MTGRKSDTVTVYGLASSEDGKIRYVGQTLRSLQTRLLEHRRKSRPGGHEWHLYRWIRSIERRGHAVVIFPIEKEAVAHLAEIRLIDWYRRHGADLVNVTNGGEGTSRSQTAVTRRKISLAHRGKKLSEAHREAVALSLTGRVFSKEHRNNLSLANLRRQPMSDKTKAKLSAANAGKKCPEVAAANRERAMKNIKRP